MSPESRASVKSWWRSWAADEHRRGRHEEGWMNEADRTGGRGFGLGHIKDISCGQVGTYSACGVYGSIRRTVEKARSAEVMDNERACDSRRRAE
jgi:hypothetical protein